MAAFLLPALLCLAMAVGGWLSPAFGERLTHMAATVTGLAFTPFILELTLASLGFVIVGGLAYLHAKADDHDWEVAGAMGGSGAATQPEPVGDVGALYAMAEGYLDLGSAGEAWDTLMQVPRSDWDSPACAALRLRHATLSKRWQEGDAVLPLLAGADGEPFAEVVARYLVAHARGLVAGEGTGARGAARAMARKLVAEAVNTWPPMRDEVGGDSELPALRQAP